MRDPRKRGDRLELNIQLTLLETEPVPPARLREGLRVLAIWLARVSRQEDAQSGNNNRKLTCLWYGWLPSCDCVERTYDRR